MRDLKECCATDRIDAIWESMKAETTPKKNIRKQSKKTRRGKRDYQTSKCVSSIQETYHPTVLDCPSTRDDSDDDSVEVGEVESQNEFKLKDHTSSLTRKKRLQQITSAIQSNEAAQRINTLQYLATRIDELILELNDKSHDDLPDFFPRKMDFPPPYDINRIVLTFRSYDNNVSDLASGKYVPRWAQWGRTQAPLSSQFSVATVEQDFKSSKKAIPSNKSKNLLINHSNENDNMTDENNAISQLQTIWDNCGMALFRRFSDPNEKCRELSLVCVYRLLTCMQVIGRQVPYLISSLLARYPATEFDEELNIFVHDKAENDWFKRGGATERQDRINLIHIGDIKIALLEKSEEIRLLHCQVIHSLIQSAISQGNLAILNPYFSDIIFALQSHLKDPYPDLKVEVSNLLVQILRIPEWENGAKLYALGLARACIFNLRHKNAKVRVASLGLFEASVCVPNREKIKGAGTDAIVDLVGFREENVLPIAAFYNAKHGVTVNCLAELAVDKSSLVRSRCCSMLSFFMVCLPDRYDYHQRLLPYLLTFLNDNNKETQLMALAALENCGKQYEAEHPSEVVERKQYGVDGDIRCNYHSPLPNPFHERPMLGTRLFVRSNVKRFFNALLIELTSWISHTRERCCQLLVILLVYCEEHLTMDFYCTLPLLVKAFKLARKDVDHKTRTRLIQYFSQIFDLIGRFVDPNTYVPLTLSHINGKDSNTATSFSTEGYHSSDTRTAYVYALLEMQRGSHWNRLSKHSGDIISTLCSTDCIGFCVGTAFKLECIHSLFSYIERVKSEITIRFEDNKNIWEAISFCRESLQLVVTNETDKDTIAKTRQCLLLIEGIM